MKKLALTVLLGALFVIPAQAHSQYAKKDHSHDTTHEHSDDRERYDYGAYLDLVKVDAFEVAGKKVDVGLKNDYLFESDEFRSRLGATVKF